MCTWRQKLPKKYNYKFTYYFLHSLPLQVITLPRFCFETFLTRYVCLTISGHPFLLKETFFPIFPSLLLYECICKNAKTKTNNQRKNSVKNVNVTNKPLPSSKNLHFQNEAKCATFLVKLSFICMRMNIHFHIKGWALNLVLIQRPGGASKWRIVHGLSG